MKEKIKIMTNLKIKTYKGLFWSFQEYLLRQSIQLIVQIFLARLLSPDFFGIISIALVFNILSQALIDGGFSQALIREKKVSKIDYSTIFFFNMFISIVIYLLIFLLSGIVANFYNEPQLELIIKIITITFVINSFGVVPRAIVQKKLNYKLQTRVTIISTFFAGITSILMAFNGFGIWSLVANTLIISIIDNTLIFLFVRWKPVMRFSMKSFNKYFNFGSKLMLSTIVSVIYNNFHQLIIGRIYSKEQLGYYSNAKKTRDLSIKSTMSPIGRVIYPIFSEANFNDNLLNTYNRTIKIISFVFFPLILSLYAISNELIIILFSDKWSESIPIFQLFCFAGFFYPISIIQGNILLVKGRSDLYLKLGLIKKGISILFVVLILFLELNIFFLISTMIVDGIIAYFMNSKAISQELNISNIKNHKLIIPSFISSSFMLLIVKFFEIYLNFNIFLNLIIKCILLFIFYMIFIIIIDREQVNFFIKELRELIKKISQKR